MLKWVLMLTLAAGGPFLAGQRRQGVGHVGQHVEQVALLGVDDLLHLGQLVAAEALLGSPCKSFARVSGALQRARSSASSLKNSGSLPNSISMNCCADIGVPSGCQKVVHHHVLDGARLAVGELDLRSSACSAYGAAPGPGSGGTGVGASGLAGGPRPGLASARGSIGSPSHSGSLKWWCAFTKS